MIIYQSSKIDFLQAVDEMTIVEQIRSAYIRHEARSPAPAEVRAWQNSLQFMAGALRDHDIAGNLSVAIEYRIPSSAKRIDVLLSGFDDECRPSLVIVELKQWSTSSATSMDGILRANRRGRCNEDGPHPSYQAWSYAELLRGFNASCEEGAACQVVLHPCAYLHNHETKDAERNVRSDFYRRYLDAAPVFLSGHDELLKLRAFIRRFIRSGDDGTVVRMVDSGEIKPSKALAQEVARLIQGKPAFVLIDEQKTVFEHIRNLALRTPKPGEKHVVIVRGGPGTGKSVVALNLLAAVTSAQCFAAYVTKNAAPRAVYGAMLKGTLKKGRIDNLFKGSDWAYDAPADAFRLLIIDEAHRLRLKSGIFGNLGRNQIAELINATQISTFFIDDAQRVTTLDAGSVAEIRRAAEAAGAQVAVFDLPSQFRCAGSDGYLAWIDDMLGVRRTANTSLGNARYDFRVFDSIVDMSEALERINEAHGGEGARLVAGYCWKWVSKNAPDDVRTHDFVLEDGAFRRNWNLSDQGAQWLIRERGLRTIGCIHTVQGLEIPYVGVIIGPDLVARGGRLVMDFRKRASGDKSIFGLKKLSKTHPDEARKQGEEIIRNTYRVLMTRGTKGCFVYSEDAETRAWLRERMLGR